MGKVKTKNLTNFMATSTPIASSKGKGLPQMKFKSTPIRTEKRKTPTIEKRRSETNIESRKKRWRPGTLALREIRAYQRTYTTLIPRASFGRLVREITSRICPTELRFQRDSLEAIQSAAESYMIQLFEDSVMAMIHGKRVTLRVSDMSLVRRIRGEKDFIYGI
ncbi:uncharacterized protein LOC136027829 [Artemia franciscana]|uniref:uncharacterized protein LOC136027829 n=1 Tax=Artemia franciscana TaxID=6661 RepID=UPI0032DA5AED